MDELNFKGTLWKESIDVRDFVFNNMTPYDGDESFLADISDKTKTVWDISKDLMKKEFKNGGVLDIDTKTVSYIDSHKEGYIDKENEVIVGLQTDKPLKRAIKPLGGVRVVAGACLEAGYELDKDVNFIFSKYRKTHNDGVFDIYTPMMRKLRSSGVLTGLPDNYARGRIIGDYRRVALYGIDKLIEEKQKEKDEVILGEMTDELMRLREDVSEQIKALNLMKIMAKMYGFDISKPATNAKEAVQWTYFAYLAALKEHDGAAMSLGNVSNFFDIYIQKDMNEGKLTEEEAQELIDQFVIKLRLVRHLRGDAYNKLFAGDPTWLTEAIGGIWKDGRHKISKTSYRFLHTLYNLGPSPEPNLTILWSKDLPENFKKFSTKVSIDTSSLQYENDDLMRESFDCDDYGISCCVSQLSTGKKMQYFGARCNLAKALLLAINNGYDEIKHFKICEDVEELDGNILDYDKVMKNLNNTIAMLAREYVNTMNVIHYSHDKYYYERAQMALLDTYPNRVMAFGIAGLSVVADSLSAIKYAKVKTLRDEKGISTGFEIEGDFPKFGNDDDRVDDIAKWLVTKFDKELHKHHIYRNATPTLSVLTITSNVVYGKKTGATPDGREAGIAFAPGANPMHGREENGAIASLTSVSKLPYNNAQDGISNTFSIIPSTLGVDEEEQVDNLVSMLDGYFTNNAHHLNVNVLNRDILLDAMENPTNYPQLTIRVSGYAVNFIKLTKEQQKEVLNRTFFDKIQSC